MSTKSLLLGAAAALVLGTSADAGQNRWYASLEGGASWINDLNGVQTCTGCITTQARFDISTDTGWAVLAAVGYEWNQWRFEGEVGYRSNDMNRILFIAGFPTTSNNLDDFTQLTLMANILYDIPLGDRFSLSLGAGIGADRVDFDWTGFGANGWHDAEWQFAWQGIVGLNYAIDPQCEIFVNYRYLGTGGGPDFSRFEGAQYDMRFERIETHTASAGLRWHFGS